MEAVIRHQFCCSLISLNRVDVERGFHIEHCVNYRLVLARNEMEGKSWHAYLVLEFVFEMIVVGLKKKIKARNVQCKCKFQTQKETQM